MTKKKIIFISRIIIIPVSVVITWYFTWDFVRVWIAPLPETVHEQVQKTIDYGFDGMIVYVDEAGKAPAFYSSGLKNRENNIPADPKSLFKIASIGKLYVAVSVAKLAHDGRLSLDKTLANYLPELIGKIEYADKITLKMMVQHRSGIPNYTDNPAFWDRSSNETEEVLRYALNLPAAFEPDSDYGYSNTNYLLIARILDQVLGYSHHQFIKEKILLPLNLKHTFSSLEEVSLDDVMSGYYVGIDHDFKSDKQGMLATAEDVGIFIRALNDGSVFEQGEQEIYSSIYVYEHTGLLPGYQSIAKYHKEIDTVVIQFLNTTNFDGNNWFISEIVYDRIVSILKAQKNKL